MSSRPLRLAAMLAIVAATACAHATAPQTPEPRIAFTFDDLPAHSSLPPGETRVDIARRIIAVLNTEHVPSYGFVNGAATEREPASTLVLSDWVAAGLPLGNHTWSHPNLNDLSLEQFEQEIARNEPLLAQVDPKHDWHWFRYPFLSEGSDPAKRAAIRTWLADHGYRIAQVTMSFGDYAYNEPYARCVAKGDGKTIAAMEQDWLDGARDGALASRAMARALYGHDIPYVLLMHIGAFDARMMPRLIPLYRSMGFGFTTLPGAEADPAYAQDMNPRLPAGPSGLEAQTAAKGLPFPVRRANALNLDALCR